MSENFVQQEKYLRNFYDTKALAEELGRPLGYIHNLHRSGILKGMKMGSSFVFRREEIEQVFIDYADYDLANYDAMVLAKAQVEKEKELRPYQKHGSKMSRFA